MRLITEPYLSQLSRWPKTGRHILAQYDDQSIVVYQAYRPAIGNFAAVYGYFGGEFSLDRMSWIKPNFLWMMYRSGWGSKAGQEVALAIWIKRSAFDEILALAVHSSYISELYPNKSTWQTALKQSIEDISDFVQQQRQNINSDCAELITPRETVYPVIEKETQKKLELSAWTE